MSEGEAVLPGVLAEIAEIAGRDAALKLALAEGGKSIHVPQPGHLQPAHPLCRATGPGAAKKIARQFAGESLYIPMARRALAKHLCGQGVPVAEVAGKLGISKSAVRRYRH